MEYEQAKDPRAGYFKHLFGYPSKAIVKVIGHLARLKKPSCYPKLSLENRVLLLHYWLEAHSYFRITLEWEISKSTICRLVQKVETKLLRAGKFLFSGKKSLLQPVKIPKTVVIDLAESLARTHKRGQPHFYSSKHKRHIYKFQVMIHPSNRGISCTAYYKWQGHNFRLWKVSQVQLKIKTKGLGDQGYQDLGNYLNSQTSKKKLKTGQLSHVERCHRILPQQRVIVKHIQRHLKIFRIISKCDRNQRRRFELRCNLIANLYNFKLGVNHKMSATVSLIKTLSHNWLLTGYCFE